MILYHETDEKVEDCLEKWAELCKRVVGAYSGEVEEKLVQAQKDVLEVLGVETPFLIKEGLIHVYDGEKQIVSLEPGEVVLTPAIFPQASLTLLTDFAVKVAPLEGYSTASATVNKYGQTFATLLLRIFASTLREEVKFTPRIRSVEAGDVIIQQGDRGSEVYTLAEGAADAYVDGVKVGEILEEEMFGVIAALCDVPRTAEVRMRTGGMVFELSKEEFVDLIRARPNTVFQLVQNLASKIQSLNEELVSSRKG